MNLGGAQFLIKGFFEKYQNQNFFLFVLRQNDLLIDVNHKNINISKSKSVYSFYPILELKKNIKANRIQVIHCYLLKSQIFGYILKKLFFPKIKLIFHELGEVFQNDRNIYKIFMKISESKVDRYLVASKATKIELINKTNISIIRTRIQFPEDSTRDKNENQKPIKNNPNGIYSLIESE